jgi:hypothetical protein
MGAAGFSEMLVPIPITLHHVISQKTTVTEILLSRCVKPDSWNSVTIMPPCSKSFVMLCMQMSSGSAYWKIICHYEAVHRYLYFIQCYSPTVWIESCLSIVALLILYSCLSKGFTCITHIIWETQWLQCSSAYRSRPMEWLSVTIINRDGNCKLFLLKFECILWNSNNIRLLTSSLLPRIWDKRALNVTVPSSVRQTNISPRGRQLNCDKVGSSVSITINTDAIRQVKIDVMSSSFPNRETAAWSTPS